MGMLARIASPMTLSLTLLLTRGCRRPDPGALSWQYHGRGWAAMQGRSDGTVSFLLRLWPTRREGGLVWQAFLQDARTGHRRAFSSLAALLSYLDQTYMAGPTPSAAGEDTQGGER